MSKNRKRNIGDYYADTGKKNPPNVFSPLKITVETKRRSLTFSCRTPLDTRTDPYIEYRKVSIHARNYLFHHQLLQLSAWNATDRMNKLDTRRGRLIKIQSFFIIWNCMFEIDCAIISSLMIKSLETIEFFYKKKKKKESRRNI